MGQLADDAKVRIGNSLVDHDDERGEDHSGQVGFILDHDERGDIRQDILNYN